MKVLPALLLLISGLLFGGCNNLNDRRPRVVGHEDNSRPLPASQSYPPPIITGGTRQEPMDVPREWIPPTALEKSWQAVVIHHSGTPTGNAEIFDRWHREGNHWEGVGYNFVIGNGSNSGDGQVEVTFRWYRQMVGAHCKTPGNWANEHAIGICLVGNFNDTLPSDRQLASLKKLLNFLRQRYRIPREEIYTHRHIPGAIVTDCPGRLFDINVIL